MKTFREWNQLGYRIRKGEKALKFKSKKEPLFSFNQVYKPNFKQQFNCDRTLKEQNTNVVYGGCYGQHVCCDVCDGITHDPNTGWGGFRDHYAGRDFKTDEEQQKYYRDAYRRGKTGHKSEDED